MSPVVAAMITLAAGGAVAGDSSHAEIKAFAGTTAIAKTMRESCPGIAPDVHFVEMLRQRL